MSLTQDDIVLLIQVLQNTPTQNLQTAQKLIAISEKLANVLLELKKAGTNG